MAYDFKAWLNLQPDNKEYCFQDAVGNCAVGQYMKSLGEQWNISAYQDHLADIGHNTVSVVQALSRSQTFGELKKALEKV